MQGRVRVASLVITDMLCVSFAWAATVVAYWCLGFGDYDPAEYVRFWPVALLFVVFNMLVRLYHGNVVYPSLPLGPVEEFRRLVASSVTVHLIVMAFLGFSRQQEEVSRFAPACLRSPTGPSDINIGGMPLSLSSSVVQVLQP